MVTKQKKTFKKFIQNLAKNSIVFFSLMSSFLTEYLIFFSEFSNINNNLFLENRKN